MKFGFRVRHGVRAETWTFSRAGTSAQAWLVLGLGLELSYPQRWARGSCYKVEIETEVGDKMDWVHETARTWANARGGAWAGVGAWAWAVLPAICRETRARWQAL